MTLLRETIFTSRLAAPLALAALPILFFWRLTFLGETLYWGTPLLQFYPWRAFAVQEYLSGQIPLWNPHVGLGAPLAANLQSAVFYPLNLVYLLIPIERAMTVTVVGHIALAGLFCYGFARLLGFSKAGAFVTGLTFMFSGYVVARAGFLSMTSVVAWLPALLWSIEGLLRAHAGGRRGSVALWLCGLAAVTAMLLLAGHAQIAAYSLAAASAYLLARSWSRWGQIATAGAGLALGAALAAVQLLPTLELARYSERHSGAAYDVATSSSLWPGQLLGLLFPNFFGSQATGDWWGPGPFWDGAVYVGVLPLLLACYGLRFAPRGQAWFFGGLALLGAFLALGQYNPVFPFFFDNVPGMNLFQGPARFWLWFTLAAAILAGYGWEGLRTRLSPGGGRVGFVAAAVGLGVIGASAGASFVLPPSTAFGAAATGGAWLLAAGLLLSVPRARFPRLWSAYALMLILADLSIFGMPLNTTTNAQLYESPSSAAALALRTEAGLDRIYTPETTYQWLQERYFNLRAFPEGDWQDLRRLRDAAMPNLATAEGLYEVYNYDPLRLERPLLVMRAAEPQGFQSPLLDMLGARYMQTPAEVTADTAGNALVTPMERPGPLPRAYVVSHVVSVPTKAAALAAISDPAFNPAATAFVESALPVPEGRPGALQAARIVEYGPQRVVIETQAADAPGLLVLSDAYYPGWRAEIDGRAAGILPTNVALRGVLLTGGPHRVVFQYDPRSFKIGLTVTALALILLTAIAVWGLRARRMELLA